MIGGSPGSAARSGVPVVVTVAGARPRSRVALGGVVVWTGVGAGSRAPGVLRRAGLKGEGGVWFDALLCDGTGQLIVRWLGRRRVPGVEPGAGLLVEGTVSVDRGRLVVLNPRYGFGHSSVSR